MTESGRTAAGRPVRILFVTDLYPTRTAQAPDEKPRALHDLVRHWVHRPGVEVRVVVPVRFSYWRPWEAPPWRSTIRIDDVPVSAIRLWRVPRTTYRFSVRNQLEHLREIGFAPDVVVGHMPTGIRCALQLGAHTARPTVCCLHQSDLLQARRHGALYRQATGLAYRSHSLRQQAVSELGLPDGFVATSGVEIQEVLPAERYLARGLHRPLRLVTVAVLREQKRLDAVLAALARLPAELEWTYDVYGDGETRAALQAQCGRLGLADRVTFHGRAPHRTCLDALAEADVFVLTSERETLGISYLEALAKGAIVVGSRGTGIDGVVVHGDNGFLCAPGDAAELCETLQHVASSDLAPVRQAALDTIRRHTLDERAGAYLDYVCGFAR